MRNINYLSKKAICIICVISALWSLGTQAATLPPDPDNAALLYYQAFLLRPEPDYDAWWSINEVLRDADPNDTLREYLNLRECRKTIEFAEAAAQLPHCDWGIRYSKGIGADLTQLSNIRTLSFLISADARVLAADGDCQAGLSRCFVIRRLAGHVGDDTMLNYLLSLAMDGVAHTCTQYVLGCMSPSVEVLTQLRGQLIVVRDTIPSLARALEMDFELSLQSVRTDPDILESLREHLAEKADDDNARGEIIGLTDEEIIDIVREPYSDFLDSVFHVMDSELMYEEKILEIQRLRDKYIDEYVSDISIGSVAVLFISNSGTVDDVFNIKVRNTAQFNALKAAIEIYLIKARTGQLPDTLPDGLPKDPYSGQDFGYEITEEGFTFHSQGEDFEGRGSKLLEFKVKQ
ncbi:MAG: hypothetical protein ACYSUX_17065 [Planctomycetota bacterium]|jgi:hypothetical protein